MMVQRFSREELYELVWSEPASKLAPRLGVSDVWLSKVCRNSDIPRPTRGYWAKLSHGKKPRRQPLPQAKSSTTPLIYIRRSPRRPEAEEQVAKVQELAAARGPITLPQVLRRPHALVERTRAQLAKTHASDDGRVYVRSIADTFEVRVSRSNESRALRILQAICVEAENRGWRIGGSQSARNDTSSNASLLIGRHSYRLVIEEKAEPQPFTDEEVSRWLAKRPSWEIRESPPSTLRRRRPTGQLSLQLPDAWGAQQRTWSDGKKSRLEDKLGEFFATLEILAESDEERWKEREREEAIRLERQRRALRDRIRVDELERQLLASAKAATIRDYVKKLRLSLSDREAERLSRWCDWADAYANNLDPVTNHDLLGQIEEEEDDDE